MQGCVWIQWSSLAHYASETHHPFSLGALLTRTRDGEGPPRRKRRWTVALHVTSGHYEPSLFASWAKHSPTCRLIYGANIGLSVKTVKLSSMFDVAPFKNPVSGVRVLSVWLHNDPNTIFNIQYIIRDLSGEFKRFTVWCQNHFHSPKYKTAM